MRKSESDVVIVGASFAGLATAYFTKGGRVLILEQQKELGFKQRSTCCTSMEWMERLNCKGSVLKTFDYLTLYSSNGHRARIKLPQTFCTIDYKKFCTTLADNLKNTEILAEKRVIGLDGNASNTVLTKDGKYSGKVLVDCSGWAGIKENNLSRRNGMGRPKPAFGLEIETDFSGDTDSFHIYYGKRYIKKGYGWIFPTEKDRARIGIGAFSIFKPHKVFHNFLKELDIKRNGLKPHGGYLPIFGIGEPVKGNAFVVGDACNHVIPLSGEGIRKAFEYAELCGGIITSILQDKLTLEEGLEAYSQEVLKAKRFYDNMRFAQCLAIYCPDWGRRRIIKTLSKTDGAKTERLLVRYFNDGITSSKAKILKSVLGGILA
ncbi:MAG: hypothetical protein ACE5HH_03615 [Candidatus Hydrothermarchaeales archaeon]